MRVGIACNSFGRSGGMEQYALKVVEALLQMGHTPVIFTMKADETLPFYNDAEVYVCRTLRRWLPNKWNVVCFNRWLSELRHIVKTDLLMGCCLSVTSEIAMCGGTHIGFLKAMRRTPGWMDRWIIDLERRMYGSAVLVVAHSEAMKRELENFYGICSEKIKVIYPPQSFKSPSVRYDRSVLRKKFSLPEDKTLFLFPSSSHKRKGIDLLKQYFSKTEFPELLVVAGRSVKQPFKNMQYVGFCDDMPSLYQACDYTVMASLYEPLGMVGAESVSCGTPAIMGRKIGCCEILDSRAVRTFDESSVEDFEQVMQEVRQHPLYLKSPYLQYVKPEAFADARAHVTAVLSIYENLITRNQG